MSENSSNKLPLIGRPVANLTLEVFHHDQTHTIKLADYRGQWLILFFYPADFTFICPTELEEMAERYNEFKTMNTEVISISRDTTFVHKAWHDHSPSIKKIQFPMAADPTGAICREFGTYIEEGGDSGLSLRATFIIDPEGVLKAFEMHDNSIGRSADELVRKLQAAQYVAEHGGEVCPASWRPGGKTLKPGMDLVGKI